MAVYHAIEKTGGIDRGLPVAQVRQLFGDGGFVRSASALSAALGEQADTVDVEVNPGTGRSASPPGSTRVRSWSSTRCPTSTPAAR